MKESTYIWKNGKLIAWNEATTHILSHTLHYGNACLLYTSDAADDLLAV